MRLRRRDVESPDTRRFEDENEVREVAPIEIGEEVSIDIGCDNETAAIAASERMDQEVIPAFSSVAAVQRGSVIGVSE